MKVVVPVEEMTNNELLSKAREVEAKGETEHANSLRQFFSIRYLVANHLLKLSALEIQKVLKSWKVKPRKGGRQRPTAKAPVKTQDPHSAKPLLTTPEAEQSYRSLWAWWEELEEEAGVWRSLSVKRQDEIRETPQGAILRYKVDSAEHVWGMIESFDRIHNITSQSIRDRILGDRPQGERPENVH